MALSSLHTTLLLISAFLLGGANAIKTLTLVNKCQRTIWPAFVSNCGSAQPRLTGFEMAPGATFLFNTTYSQCVSIWARTGCRFDKATGKGKCATGDCQGLLQCDGWQASPPATIATFMMDEPQGDEYYVDLVKGFNIPVSVTPVGGMGDCKPIACGGALLQTCPAQLQLKRKDGRVIGCKNACDVFGDPKTCCQDPFFGPKCPETEYSKAFRAACPMSAIVTTEDKSVQCKSMNYTVTFC